MREVINEYVDYRIYMYRRSFDKKELVIGMINLSINLSIIIAFIICAIVIPNSAATALLNGLSIFCILGLLLFIPLTIDEWRKCDTVGSIDDYTLTFEILEKKELVLYTFNIKEIKELKLLDKKNIAIYIKNGQSFLIENICNAKKVVEIYKKIKN